MTNLQSQINDVSVLVDRALSSVMWHCSEFLFVGTKSALFGQCLILYKSKDSTSTKTQGETHFHFPVSLVAYGSGIVSVWLPEPTRDRGSKQKTLNDDCYHTTYRCTAIFGVQAVLSYLVSTPNLWIGLCPMKRSSGVWRFDDVSVTHRSRRAMFR